MQEPRDLEALPTGLMMRMAHNTRAMEGFFALPYDRREALLENIRTAPTGDEAKSRIEHTIDALMEGGGYEPHARFE